jgi:hypothetical protein
LAAGLTPGVGAPEGDGDGLAVVGASLALGVATGDVVAVPGPVPLLVCGSGVDPLPGSAFCGAIVGVAVGVKLDGARAAGLALAPPLITALCGIGALPCWIRVA